MIRSALDYKPQSNLRRTLDAWVICDLEENCDEDIVVTLLPEQAHKLAEILDHVQSLHAEEQPNTRSMGRSAVEVLHVQAEKDRDELAQLLRAKVNRVADLAASLEARDNESALREELAQWQALTSSISDLEDLAPSILLKSESHAHERIDQIQRLLGRLDNVAEEQAPTLKGAYSISIQSKIVPLDAEVTPPEQCGEGKEDGIETEVHSLKQLISLVTEYETLHSLDFGDFKLWVSKPSGDTRSYVPEFLDCAVFLSAEIELEISWRRGHSDHDGAAYLSVPTGSHLAEYAVPQFGCMGGCYAKATIDMRDNVVVSEESNC